MDSHQSQVLTGNNQDYDRAKEVKAFDDSKSGVKGLVDAGIAKIPQFFVMPPEDILYKKPGPDFAHFTVPVIDLKGVNENSFRHRDIVEKFRYASEKLGFFQILNHGIPQNAMKEMIEGVRRFNEQANEGKMEFYSRESEKKVRFNSNFDLYKAKAANWRDTLFCVMAPNPPLPDEYPATCREIMIEYSGHVGRLGQTLFQLLSEALGLQPNHLQDMECNKGHAFVCHYYPACPEPDRTLGHAKHCDPDFLTILLQDHIGGLQVLHQNHWFDIPPVDGALVVNIGDLLQLISNDKFRSGEHRVLAQSRGTRISVACFFTTHFQPSNKLYGPMKELLSDDNPPLYRETSIKDYISSYCSAGLGGVSALSHLRL